MHHLGPETCGAVFDSLELYEESLQGKCMLAYQVVAAFVRFNDSNAGIESDLTVNEQALLETHRDRPLRIKTLQLRSPLLLQVLYEELGLAPRGSVSMTSLGTCSIFWESSTLVCMITITASVVLYDAGYLIALVVAAVAATTWTALTGVVKPYSSSLANTTELILGVVLFLLILSEISAVTYSEQ